MSSQSEKSNEIWSLIKETRKDIQELTTSQKKTGKDIQELTTSQKKTGKDIQELTTSQKKTGKDIQELTTSQKKTGKDMQELATSQKEMSKEIKKAQNLFITQWGRLMESLVEGDLVRLMKEKGIEIERTSTNEKGLMSYFDEKGVKQKKQCEIDIIAKNGEEIVVVEVKTTLTVEDVLKFLDVLNKFTLLLPEYRDKRVYGAVAYLRSQDSSEIYSEKQGLFVIKATGSSASITNKEDFKPKAFSSCL